MDIEQNKKQIGNLHAQLVVKIVQKLFPNKQWANDFGNDSINVKLFFVVLVVALVLALIFVGLIQLGVIN
jgi:hypothetical protein